MADRSAIEWTDATWNPIRARSLLAKGGIGWHCEKVSDGCRNCYAEPMNRDRFGTGLAYKPGNAGKVDIYLDEDVLRRPLSWRRPRRVFPGSMTDIFGDWVTDRMLDRTFAVMALTPQHTYQVLTKRSPRMRAYLSDGNLYARVHELIFHAEPEIPLPKPTDVDATVANMDSLAFHRCLRNVWLGVSTEDQRRADERVPDLLATPAAIRFVSAEPLLGPIRFSGVSDDRRRKWNWLTGETGVMYPDGPDFDHGPKLDQIIVGGESGNGARVWDGFYAAARSLRDQCQLAGTAFFMKQTQGVLKSRMPAIPEDLLIRDMPHAR